MTPESDLPKGLAKPAQRALAGAGYTRLDQLAKVTEADIEGLHGIGKNALTLLRQALAEKGLSFAVAEDGFPRAIGNPATDALRVAGYTRLDQLTKVTAAEILALHGVGPKAIAVLRETLKAKGMSFAGE